MRDFLFEWFGAIIYNMELTRTPLKSVDQTVAAMFGLINNHVGDMKKFATMRPADFFKKLKMLPYRADPKGNEFLQRPVSVMNGLSPYRDCDDKAIMAGAYAKAAGIPYRIVIAGSHGVPRKNFFGKPVVAYPFHHVFTEFMLGGEWVPFDATYPRYTAFTHNQDYKSRKVFYPPA